MPRDAVSRTANFERTGRHKWVIQSGPTQITGRYITLPIATNFLDNGGTMHSALLNFEIYNRGQCLGLLFIAPVYSRKYEPVKL